jgi:hypothetical protein
MIKYNECLKSICSLGCDFKNDQIFKKFLEKIEKYGKREINFFNTFKRIITRIVKHNAGTLVNPKEKDGEKQSDLNTIDNMYMNVVFKDKHSEYTIKSRQIIINKIEINKNKNLEKKPKKYSRYL